MTYQVTDPSVAPRGHCQRAVRVLIFACALIRIRAVSSSIAVQQIWLRSTTQPSRQLVATVQRTRLGRFAGTSLWQRKLMRGKTWPTSWLADLKHRR